MAKYYAVCKGRKPGIYSTWDEAKRLVDGFPGAVFKSFASYEQAVEFITKATGHQLTKATGHTRTDSHRNVPKPSQPVKVVADVPATKCVHKLFFDGASRSNPGLSSIGYIIKDWRGSTISLGAERLSYGSTNNEAEYGALLQGMRKAASLSIEHLCAYGDSNLICSQVSGAMKVKQPNMQLLHSQVMKLKSSFISFSAEYIPRALNIEADALANLALDTPPAKLQAILAAQLAESMVHAAQESADRPRNRSSKPAKKSAQTDSNASLEAGSQEQQPPGTSRDIPEHQLPSAVVLPESTALPIPREDLAVDVCAVATAEAAGAGPGSGRTRRNARGKTRTSSAGVLDGEALPNPPPGVPAVNRRSARKTSTSLLPASAPTATPPPAALEQPSGSSGTADGSRCVDGAVGAAVPNSAATDVTDQAGKVPARRRRTRKQQPSTGLVPAPTVDSQVTAEPTAVLVPTVAGTNQSATLSSSHAQSTTASSLAFDALPSTASATATALQPAAAALTATTIIDAGQRTPARASRRKRQTKSATPAEPQRAPHGSGSSMQESDSMLQQATAADLPPAVASTTAGLTVITSAAELEQYMQRIGRRAVGAAGSCAAPRTPPMNVATGRQHMLTSRRMHSQHSSTLFGGLRL